MQLGSDERRALAVLLGLLLLASAARWVDRPRPLLPDAPALDVAALEEASRAAKAPPRAAKGKGPVAINTAPARELEALPGVGPAVAGRIVEERERGGPFADLAELQARVRGVGPALVAKWEGLTELPPASAARASPGRASPEAGAGTAPARSTPTPGRPDPAPAGAAGAAVAALDLNRAAARDLEKISGVGPILAGRLVARRDSLGGFRDWAEVDAVPGVGPAMLARLKGLAVLGQ